MDEVLVGMFLCVWNAYILVIFAWFALINKETLPKFFAGFCVT
jgi:hypothetical protein